MMEDQPIHSVRCDGWTPVRRSSFLNALAEGADVAAAAKACDMSRQGAYRLRGCDAAFARQWDAARARTRARQQGEYLAVVADIQARALRKIAYWKKSPGHCPPVHFVSTSRDHAMPLGNERIG